MTDDHRWPSIASHIRPLPIINQPLSLCPLETPPHTTEQQWFTSFTFYWNISTDFPGNTLRRGTPSDCHTDSNASGGNGNQLQQPNTQLTHVSFGEDDSSCDSHTRWGKHTPTTVCLCPFSIVGRPFAQWSSSSLSVDGMCAEFLYLWHLVFLKL